MSQIERPSLYSVASQKILRARVDRFLRANSDLGIIGRSLLAPKDGTTTILLPAISMVRSPATGALRTIKFSDTFATVWAGFRHG